MSPDDGFDYMPWPLVVLLPKRDGSLCTKHANCPAVSQPPRELARSVRLDRRPGIDVVGVIEVRQFPHGVLQATELFVQA